MNIISYVDEPRYVDEYDFTFDNGLFLTVIVDRDAGDTIDTAGNDIVFQKASRPSLSDAKVLVPAEEITVSRRHLIMVQKRSVLQTNPTPEQKDEFQKTLHKLSATVN